MTANYLRDYTCSGCGARAIKLWRDYNTCADAVELKCATCATPAQIEYEARTYTADSKSTLGALDDDNVFTFRDGDQLGGLVPAIPTDDGHTFWGYSSVPADRVEWWHALPTYTDDKLELRCLRHLFLRHLQSEHWLGKRLAQERETVRDLEWKRDRTVYLPTHAGLGREITIWGTATKDVGDGYVIRYGEEQKHKIEPFDRIVEAYGRAFLLTKDDEDKVDRAWSIVDCDSDGLKFIEMLRKEQAIVHQGMVRR